MNLLLEDVAGQKAADAQTEAKYHQRWVMYDDVSYVYEGFADVCCISRVP